MGTNSNRIFWSRPNCCGQDDTIHSLKINICQWQKALAPLSHSEETWTKYESTGTRYVCWLCFAHVSTWAFAGSDADGSGRVGLANGEGLLLRWWFDGRSDCMQLSGWPIVFSPSLMQIMTVHVMYAWMISDDGKRSYVPKYFEYLWVVLGAAENLEMLTCSAMRLEAIRSRRFKSQAMKFEMHPALQTLCIWYDTTIQWLIDFFMQSIQVFFFQSLWMSHKMHRKVPSLSLLNVNHWAGDSPEIPIQMLTAYPACCAQLQSWAPSNSVEKVTWRDALWCAAMMDFWCWNLFSRERKVLRAAFRDSEPDHAWSI